MTTFSKDARRLVLTRALRGFLDGAVSIVLASHLERLGFDAFETGAIVASTLFGSAGVTLGVGLLGHRYRRKSVLLFAAVLMLATGIGFALATGFWLLLLIAFVGTMNPSAGDVSLFLPSEQAALSETVESTSLTSTFAWYNLAGALAGALGALASGVPLEDDRLVFWLYAALALVVAGVYAGLTPKIEPAATDSAARPLSASRSVVIRLTLLFSLDAFGGGFVVQSLLVLWLGHRFELAPETVGAAFFGSGLLGALSQLLSSRLAARIGRIQTMVYTHIPANLLLILAAVMPTAPLAIACLLARASVSSMDVPARQSFVMAVVPPEERAAASSVTNVPRSLASAIGPILAGAMLARSSFGWPLVCAGVLKTTYDLLLFASFRRLVPADEVKNA
jgi:MFS family permease